MKCMHGPETDFDLDWKSIAKVPDGFKAILDVYRDVRDIIWAYMKDFLDDSGITRYFFKEEWVNQQIEQEPSFRFFACLAESRMYVSVISKSRSSWWDECIRIEEYREIG